MAQSRREIAALKVHQWLTDWDDIPTDRKSHRAPPPHHFYVFSMPASELRILSGIYRRSADPSSPRADDLGIQRRHDRERSDEIREFRRFGYPWSTLNKTRRESGEYRELKKPGWLPTAIVVNLLTTEDKRPGGKVDEADVVEVVDRGEREAVVKVPSSAGWKPRKLAPIEVIDGQHRLWAFDGPTPPGKFEVPVVAFHGLDISWQAYLFWTINIKPKRIKSSLAFDLYPLLRAEDWLNKGENLLVYRESRAQELTEAVWSNPKSPWYGRINMLGEPGGPSVSQAAWIRSLMSTYIRSWDSHRNKLGGLFGAPMGKDEEVLPWTRAQQASFLIHAWSLLAKSVRGSRDEWAQDLRASGQTTLGDDDLAFRGPYTLLNTDQGVRGVLYITNDLCYVREASLKLAAWASTEEAEAVDVAATDRETRGLEKQPVAEWLAKICGSLASYDWRSSSAPNLDESERRLKIVFRGSSGYKEIRLQLLEHLAKEKGDLGKASKEVRAEVGVA